MNHNWSHYGNDLPGVQEYDCLNCGLMKEVVTIEYSGYDGYIRRFGGDILYWGKVEATIIEPTCGEIIMKEVME